VEIDRLCLEFLVRQQPVAGPLWMVYSAIQINLELERIGDSVESIARQALKLIGEATELPLERYVEIAELSVQMLRDAVDAFVRQDTALARRTIRAEDAVDDLKSRIRRDLVRLYQDQRLPFEVLGALMVVALRFERISDQARNICLEVLYMCTGEPARHPHSGVFRVLFVDSGSACRDPLAAVLLVNAAALVLRWRSRMDEPCSALDAEGTRAIEELMFSLRSRYTIAIVTHNMAQARRASDECVFMLLGEIVEHRRTEDLFMAPRGPGTAECIEGRYG